MSLTPGNLFGRIPPQVPDELREILLSTPHLQLERIISAGQATPPGQWYDQDSDEWVVVLAGSAGLLLEGEAKPRVLRPGDYVHLPAHLRHRVAWTDPNQKTIWLALHYR